MAGAARHAAGRAGAAARPRTGNDPCAAFQPRRAYAEHGRTRAPAGAAAQHGVTLSSSGAAFAAVLARWSGRHAFLLNVPLFDRHGDAPDLGRVIADFTTLLLVECDLRADASAADAVRAFQQRLHGAIAQAAYPALDVLRDARRQGTPRAAPVVFRATSAMRRSCPMHSRACSAICTT